MTTENPTPLRLTPADAGRFALGPCRFPGAPVVVQLYREHGRWMGDCVYGIFRGRPLRLDNPWEGAVLLSPGDVVRLDGGDGERPPGGKVGRAVDLRWEVLDGDAADAAWAAAVADEEAP